MHPHTRVAGASNRLPSAGHQGPHVRCRNCEYPLWNLKTRQCPECGADFLPSSYEFEPHSTRFCCPHCDHPYYGTSETGHVEPSAFACLKCGAVITLDDMVLRPGLGVDEQRTKRTSMPWLERKDHGRIRAWFMMIGRAMVTPRDLAASVPSETPLLGAWLYALLTVGLIAAAGVGLPQIVFAFPRVLWSGGSAVTMAPLAIVTQALAWVVGTVVVGGAVLWLWAGFAHVVLLLTGGASGGARRTCHAFFYSAGASVLSAVPCFGILLGWIWWSVSAGVMLAQMHRVHALRGIVAVGLFPGVVVGVMIGVMFYSMWTSMATFGGGGPGGAPTQQVWTFNQAIVQSLTGAAAPTHAAELLLTSTWQPTGYAPTPATSFLDPSTNTRLEDVPLGDTTLAAFEKATRSQQLQSIIATMESLPAGMIAHRLGDFVFTYHGATLSAASPLWLVVMIPDPDVNPLTPETRIAIGSSDMQVSTATLAELPGLLATQNAARASAGLGPLPDLTTVTHAAPAVSRAEEGE